MFGIPEKHIDYLEANHADCAENPADSVIEECGELITALAKYGADRLSYDDIRMKAIEEMAHVLISMNCLARQFFIDESHIRNEVYAKGIKAGYDVSEY